MDILTSETCRALNNEIIKQVTSSWSLFIQLHNIVFSAGGWGLHPLQPSKIRPRRHVVSLRTPSYHFTTSGNITGTSACLITDFDRNYLL